MTKSEEGICHDLLCSRMSYDPETGIFRWKNGKRANKIAGTQNRRRYRYMWLDGHFFLAHRLAWFYVHRVWPKNEIDHVNGDPSDNSIRNLREATSSENCINRIRRGFERTPTGKFAARIHPPGFEKYIFLGTFDTEEEASVAYQQANIFYYGGFSPFVSRQL